MKLLFLNQKEYYSWLSKLMYHESKDPKGDIGVNYIRCSQVGISFPKNVEYLSVDENINGLELIEVVTGEQTSIFKKNDIKNYIEERGLQKGDSNELYELSLTERHKCPTIALLYPSYESKSEQLLLDKPIKMQGVSDGDLILIQQNSIPDLISTCESILRLREVQFCIMPLRSGDDFFKNLWHIENKKILPLDEETLRIKFNKIRHKISWFRRVRLEISRLRRGRPNINWFREGRPKVALLYTDEDVNVASYVRTHFDSLDKASGNDCDVLVGRSPVGWKERKCLLLPKGKHRANPIRGSGSPTIKLKLTL